MSNLLSNRLITPWIEKPDGNFCRKLVDMDIEVAVVIVNEFSTSPRVIYDRSWSTGIKDPKFADFEHNPFLWCDAHLFAKGALLPPTHYLDVKTSSLNPRVQLLNWSRS